MTKQEAIEWLKSIRRTSIFEQVEAIDMAIEALSTERTGKWIPVSERLPEKTGWYVVTVVGFATITDVLCFYEEVSAWSDITDKQKVIAWMPLPEPYKGGDTE